MKMRLGIRNNDRYTTAPISYTMPSPHSP